MKNLKRSKIVTKSILQLKPVNSKTTSAKFKNMQKTQEKGTKARKQAPKQETSTKSKKSAKTRKQVHKQENKGKTRNCEEKKFTCE